MNNLTNDLKKLAQEIINTDTLDAESFNYIKEKASSIYDQALIGLFLVENIDKIQTKRKIIDPAFSPTPPSQKENIQKILEPIATSFEETKSEFIKKEVESLSKDSHSDKTKTTIKKSLNDIINGQFNLSLNDRIIFTKHLFKNSPIALDKAIEKISTFQTWEEANKYISTVIKPQFNDWEGKEHTALRFLDWIEQNFNH